MNTSVVKVGKQLKCYIFLLISFNLILLRINMQKNVLYFYKRRNITTSNNPDGRAALWLPREDLHFRSSLWFRQP